MRKITAIAVALGFLTSVSLPAFATPAVNGVVKSDELSAKKKKKTEKKDEKKSALGTDLSAKKKKKTEKKDEKKSDLGMTDLSAKKKKEDGEEGREEVGARHRSLRQEKEKDRRREEGREEVRDSLSHRGLIAISNLEFLHKRPDMTSGRFFVRRSSVASQSLSFENVYDALRNIDQRRRCRLGNAKIRNEAASRATVRNRHSVAREILVPFTHARRYSLVALSARRNKVPLVVLARRDMLGIANM